MALFSSLRPRRPRPPPFRPPTPHQPPPKPDSLLRSRHPHPPAELGLTIDQLFCLNAPRSTAKRTTSAPGQIRIPPLASAAAAGPWPKEETPPGLPERLGTAASAECGGGTKSTTSKVFRDLRSHRRRHDPRCGPPAKTRNAVTAAKPPTRRV
ncbi:hypothetical protein CKAH01_09195 [Colletotrichum kahawae]|uniref:Uncharacterized protein n=1 Tax=Colletotrichum kahawae TaxID=34407 RepID=A0AAD9Y0Z0_COLKA|nr:hypothetical protein CKAH01_09195 [Colletotrichum kahawae]